jgi:hypothetical protein
MTGTEQHTLQEDSTEMEVGLPEEDGDENLHLVSAQLVLNPCICGRTGD